MLNIILLDTSASTIGKLSLASAKGAIFNLATHSYLERQSFCLMTFGCDAVDVVLAPQRTPKNIKPLLESIRAGGGTPLRKALMQASFLIEKQSHHYETCKLFIFTDGRSRDDVASIHIPCDVIVVDTENSAVRLGMGEGLSCILNADYIQIEQTIN